MAISTENCYFHLESRSVLTLGIPDSSWSMICVLRAILELKRVGSARASSNELVCRDWVPPNTAAMASMVVRMMLLYGSCRENEGAVTLGNVSCNLSHNFVTQFRHAVVRHVSQKRCLGNAQNINYVSINFVCHVRVKGCLSTTP